MIGLQGSETRQGRVCSLRVTQDGTGGRQSCVDIGGDLHAERIGTVRCTSVVEAGQFVAKSPHQFDILIELITYIIPIVCVCLSSRGVQRLDQFLCIGENREQSGRLGYPTAWLKAKRLFRISF